MESGQQHVNGWTPDILAYHTRSLMDERDRRYGEVSAAQKEAVEAALKSAQLAVDKAEAINIAWRANANEWRTAMNDKDKNFLTKDVARGYFITGLMSAGVIVAIVELVIRLLPHRSL